MEKIDINLVGVPKTLLLPLLGRAVFSSKPYSPIHDALAVEMIKNINFDFDTLSKKIGNMKLFWVARAYYFDQAIKSFLKKNPDATIVNLGAGLETTFFRVDNRKLQWIDIDLPEVIDLRKKLLPSHERVEMIAKSLLDFSWIKDVKKKGNKFLFFAGGVFMYFPEHDVKAILTKMGQQFPSSHLLFDVVSKKNLQYSNKLLSKANMTDVKLDWAMSDYKELEQWSPNIKIISQASYFKKLKTRHNFPITLQIRMFLSDIFHQRKIIHLKFVPDKKTKRHE